MAPFNIANLREHVEWLGVQHRDDGERRPLAFPVFPVKRAYNENLILEYYTTSV